MSLQLSVILWMLVAITSHEVWNTRVGAMDRKGSFSWSCPEKIFWKAVSLNGYWLRVTCCYLLW